MLCIHLSISSSDVLLPPWQTSPVLPVQTLPSFLMELSQLHPSHSCTGYPLQQKGRVTSMNFDHLTLRGRGFSCDVLNRLELVFMYSLTCKLIFMSYFNSFQHFIIGSGCL